MARAEPDHEPRRAGRAGGGPGVAGRSAERRGHSAAGRRHRRARGARGFTRGLPRLSNAGFQALARAALARETAAPAAEVHDRRRGRPPAFLVRESQDDSRLRARHRDWGAFRYLDKRPASATCRTLLGAPSSTAASQRLRGQVEFLSPRAPTKRRAPARCGARLAPPPARLARDVRDRAPLGDLAQPQGRPTARTSWAGSGWRPARGDPAARATEGYRKPAQGRAGPARASTWAAGTSLSANAVTESSRSCWRTARRTSSRRARRSTSPARTRRGSRSSRRRTLT